MKERLTAISKEEGCDFSASQLDCVLDLAGGDMRRAVTTLQSAHALSGTGDLTPEDFAELAGLPPDAVVDQIWSSLDGNFEGMQGAVDSVSAEGYSTQALLVALSQKVLKDETLTELAKAQMAIRIAEAEKNLVDGADEYLQLMTVTSLGLKCMKESKNAKK